MNSAGRVYISRHVQFNESVFPFASVSSSSHTSSFQTSNTSHKPQILLPPSSLLKHPQSMDASTSSSSSVSYVPPSPSVPPTALPFPFSSCPSTSSGPLSPPSPPPLHPTSSVSTASPPCPPGSLANIHPMVTRGKSGIFKPKAMLSHVSPDFCVTEPTRVADALASPPWKAAMDTEFGALQRSHTWTLVPPTPTMNIVGCKWVFRLKRHSDGTIDRYKARLVAKGFHQHPGVDFFETFNPVVKASTVRVVLSIGVARGWKLRQLDFNNAFLNGELTEDIYMAQPPGYVDSSQPQSVCKLRKAIYGLKQAPRAWNEALTTTPCSWGFSHSKADSSLFIHLIVYTSVRYFSNPSLGLC